MYYLEDNERKYDEVLTVDELMDYLAVGKSTAYKLLREEKIKAFRIGRVYKIPKEAVREYVRKQK